MPEMLTEGYFRWRCRRGTKELDFILNRFIDKKYSEMLTKELKQFDAFLANEDTELWYWLSGKTTPEDPDTKALVKRICAAGYHKK